MSGEILDRRQSAQAIEASAALLERIGGAHIHAARLLRRQLAGVAALRLAHRDRAIVELRATWLAHLPTATAAREIATQLRRYHASAWRRSDRAFVEPPARYIGTTYELLFRISTLSGDRPPGYAAIRAVVSEAAKISGVENSRRLGLLSRQMEKPPVTFVDNKLTATLRSLPGFEEAEKRAVDEEIAERKRHLAAIEKLAADGAKAWASEEKRKGDAIARVRQAELDLRTANVELNAVVGAVAGERLARETKRREHEGALLRGDWSAIDLFVDEAGDEMRRTQKAIVVTTEVKRNRATGRTERATRGNAASVRGRLDAILASIRDAPNLRLIPDVREIPAKLAEMRASWPPIADVPDATTRRDSKEKTP